MRRLQKRAKRNFYVNCTEVDQALGRVSSPNFQSSNDEKIEQMPSDFQKSFTSGPTQDVRSSLDHETNVSQSVKVNRVTFRNRLKLSDFKANNIKLTGVPQTAS